MKCVQVTCPQCGRSDAYFEYEKGDFTNPNIWFVQQPWKCRSCGYPDVIWDRWFNYTQITKTHVNFKITDQDGNIIKEYNE